MQEALAKNHTGHVMVMFLAALTGVLTSTSTTFLTERRLPDRDIIVPEESPLDFSTPLQGEQGMGVTVEPDAMGTCIQAHTATNC